MKRIVTLILCLCFTFCIVPAVSASGSSQDSSTGERLETLQGLGLWGGPVSDLTRTVTRAKFIEMIDRLYHIPVEESDQDYFTDVPKSHESHDAISAAAGRGIISGAAAEFEPDREILVEEAIKIMVSAQGFTPYALENGGYPAGYLKCARTIGLSGGLVQGQTITYEELAGLFYRAIESEVFVPVEIGGEKTSYEYRENVLSEFHKIYKVTDQVTATYDSTLYGESNLQKNRVRIGEAEYEADYVKVSGMLGLRVDAYYQDTRNTEPKLVYLRPANNTKTVAVLSEDIISFQEFTLKYYSGGRDTTAKLSSTAAFIYNGQAIADPADFSEELLLPENGEVLLIDNGNGYEVVRILDYQTVVVSAVSQNNESFYDKYTGKPVELAAGDKVSMVDKSGNEVPLSRLSEFDVASVAISKGENRSIRIIVSADAVEGAVSQVITDPDGRKVAYLSKEPFELTTHFSDWLDSQGKSLGPGDTGVFYLDHLGRIAAYELGKSEGSKYAYLVGTAKEVFDSVFVKLLDQDGIMREMQLADRVFFGDDSKAVSAGEAYQRLVSLSGAQRLMMIKTDGGGKLRNISLPVPDGGDGPILQTYDHSLGDLKYKDVSQCFGGLYNIDDNTLIFNVPTQDTEDRAEDQDYEVQKKTTFFANDTQYSISAFITEKDVLVQDIILAYEDVGTGGGNIQQDARLGIVQEISTTLDEDGTQIQNLKVQLDGKAVDYKADEKALLDGIHEGDGVRVDVNSRGYIRMIEKLFDYQAGKVLTEKAAGYDDLNFIFYGQVVRKDGGVIQLERLNDAGLAERVNIRIRGNIYHCRELRNGDLQIASGTINDINDRKAMGDEASHVLVQSRYSDTKVVVIYD